MKPRNVPRTDLFQPKKETHTHSGPRSPVVSQTTSSEAQRIADAVTAQTISFKK